MILSIIAPKINKTGPWFGFIVNGSGHYLSWLILIQVKSRFCWISGKICGPRDSGRLEYDEIDEAPALLISGSGQYEHQDSFEESHSEVAVVIPDTVL